MHHRRKAILLATAIILAAPATTYAVAQSETATEPQQSSGDDTLWNVLGLLGLLGLVGLKRDSDNDGYTDDPI